MQIKLLNGGEIHDYLLRATEFAAGYDILVTKRFIIDPNSSFSYNTGFSVFIDNPSICALALPRSSVSTKKGVYLENTIGLIDPDYQGEIILKLANRHNVHRVFNVGDRIAQLLFVPVYHPSTFSVVEEFTHNTERGTGGFGSTG